MNALSENTPMFADVDGKYGVYSLKELFELHKQGRAIKVPALLDEHGDIGWIDVEDVVHFGLKSLKQITLTSSRLFLEISQEAIIPAFCPNLFSGNKKRIYLRFKLVNELNITELVKHNNTILLTTRIPFNIPEGDQKERDYGFALGYWLAEGSKVKRKRKNTKQSLATLNWYAKQKGMTLQQYLKYKTDIGRVIFSVGQSDFERGYIQILQRHFKFTSPCKIKNKNAYNLYSSDSKLIHLIMNYREGDDSHTKHLKNKAFNRTKKFLEGIMDGFLSGDGCYVKTRDLFSVGITTNNMLYNDLIFLAKVLGYDVHLRKAIYSMGGFANSKFYWSLKLGIFKTYHRRTALGLVKEHIKKIDDADLKEAFNLVLKPLYADNDNRAKFNSLYFTAYGFLVSDAVKTFAKLLLTKPEVLLK